MGLLPSTASPRIRLTSAPHILARTRQFSKQRHWFLCEPDAALAKSRRLDYCTGMHHISSGSVPTDIVHRIHHKFWTYLLFWSIIAGSVIAVPGYGLIYGYSWLDWTMFTILYIVTGLGITVGYHRLLTHRSFECPDWVKACLLIAGRGGSK